MLRAPLNLFKKAAGWLASEQAATPEELDVPSGETADTTAEEYGAINSENNAVGFAAVKLDAGRVGTYAATERFSVIVAVYNVGRYLDEFFESVVNQTADFWSCIEVILVDDGSTDDSAEICRRWVESYPGNIKYFKQENSGQGAARNRGLRHARHDWVTFIDPDDFVSGDYFEQVDRAIKKHLSEGKTLTLVSTNLIFYREAEGNFQNGHPLRYRFAKGDVAVPASNLGKHVVLSASASFFWRPHLMAERLTFDVRIKPSFEDGHFINRYAVSSGNADAIFLTAPKYYYRKRGDASSTIDTSWEHPARYDEQLRYGYLDLIDYCLKRTGEVPVFVQRTLLYDLAWHFKRLINDDPIGGWLGEDGVQEYQRLLHAIMDHVSEEVILNFDLAGVWFYHKVGLLSVFKNTAPELSVVYCERYDSTKCLLELKHYSSHKSCAEEFKVNGTKVIPVYSSSRCHSMLGAAFVYERSIWIEVKSGSIQASVAGTQARLSVGGKQHRTAVPLQTIITALRHKAVAEKGLPDDVIALRRAAREPEVMRKYRGSWLLMDRDTQADDNAEHLYRFMMLEYPHVRSFFVLRPDSPDWGRLALEGFRLIEFGSVEHKLALLNADHLVSSHADQYIFGELENKHFGDMLGFKYTFLQHGVTKDDISRWLNKKNIACFITATKPEYDSIVNGESYKYSRKEVVLTGFPRHDRLLALRREPEKTIVIMPTWRNSLAGPTLGQGNARAINPEFFDSLYARSWRELLCSEMLRKVAQEKGYKVVFFPHANVAPYIEGFKLPPHVEVRVHDASVSIQQLFASAAVMVTDYSSVAFEMAYIDRSIIYFQFDRDSIFSGDHIYQKGYFEYERDGFGPVCQTAGEVLTHLEYTVRAGCVPAPEYQARIATTFKLRDGQCCRRTYEAIVALDMAEVPEQARIPALLDFARRAFAFAEWQEAYDAWQQLHGKDEVPEAEAVFNLAVCARKLGLIEECAAYLDEAERRDLNAAVLLREQAALAAARGQFQRAVAYYEHWRVTNVPTAADADFMADMARAARLAGDDAKAESLLAEVQDSEHPTVQWERAELASLRQSWEEAMERWSVLAANAGQPEARLKYAEALLNLEQVEAAREALAGLPWDGVPLDLTRQRAELAFKLLDWKAAVRAWSIVEASGEMTPDDWLKFAKAYRKRGDLALAEQALENGRDSTDERTLMQERALLLSTQERWPEAVEAWQAFLNRRDLSPNRDGWLYLARAQMNSGDLETALRTVQRFAKARGDTEESLALRAEIELAMGQAPSATAPDDADRPEQRGGAQAGRTPADAMA